MNPGTLDRNIWREVASAAAPLSLDAATSLATSVYGSLILAEILRACRCALQEHFVLQRLSLVHHRANELTATLYSLDEGGDAPLIGPKVIVLEDSRLKQCIVEQELFTVQLDEDEGQDAIEKRHLLHPNTGAVLYSPLILRGRFKGVLVLALAGGSSPTPAHMNLLSYTTAHLAVAIENSDMHYLECRRGRQLSMVSEIAKQAVMVEDLGDFLRTASERIRISFDYLEVQIWTVGSGPEALVLAAWACRSSNYAEPRLPAMVEECARQVLSFVRSPSAGGAPLVAETEPQPLVTPCGDALPSWERSWPPAFSCTSCGSWRSRPRRAASVPASSAAWWVTASRLRAAGGSGEDRAWLLSLLRPEDGRP